MTAEAAILERALKLCSDHAPRDEELRNLLLRLQRRATVLLFAPVGRNAHELPLWEVGDYHDPVVFASKSHGVRALHMLVKTRTIAVALVNEAGAGAARKTLERGVAEIARYAPGLADALDACRCIRKDVVLFRGRDAMPHILTERLRNVRMSSDSAVSLDAERDGRQIWHSLSKEIRS